jgi:hypothetical protein
VRATTYTQVWGGGQSITLLEGSQASPTRSSGRSSLKRKRVQPNIRRKKERNKERKALKFKSVLN